MLGKLLKYNLKDSFKKISVFYCLAIFFSLLTRLFFSFENSFILNIIASILNGITISMIINILINNLIRVWVRFSQNLYGDESYLTHTLPVTKNSIYLSKILTSIIVLFTSVLVIALTMFIAYYSKENISIVKNFLLPFAEIYDSTIIGIILAFLLILFLEILNGLQTGFTGIILGHRMNNSKTGFSVLYGLIAYMISQIFVVAITFIFAVFDNDIMNLFYTIENLNVDTIKMLIYIAFGAYTLSIVINYFINQCLFKKGVNVD